MKFNCNFGITGVRYKIHVSTVHNWLFTMFASTAGVRFPHQNMKTRHSVATRHQLNILSYVGVCAWLIRRVLDWMIIFIDTLYTVLGTTGNCSAIAELHILHFTVTYAVGLSVFTSRILATGLEQSHCNFKSPIKSSFHSLVSFLPFILKHLWLPSPEL
jgi:hypothetical protein